MRPATELNESRTKGTLGKDILIFSQGFRSLLITSPEVLADTVLILQQLVSLSDKVLPLKSYFNLVQQVQKTSYLAHALAVELTNALPANTQEEREARDQQAADLEFRLRSTGAAQLATVFTEEARNVAAVSGVTPTGRADMERTLIRKLDLEARRRLCTEDVFMAACSFLDVEVSKQGSVHYLRGEAPDLKETKLKRTPLNLKNESELKTLSSALAKPDEGRGNVERNQIDSGFNHLVRLNRLYIQMTEVVKWIKEGDKNNTLRQKQLVRERFELSHTDYERVMAMARREGMLTFRNRKQDPTNKYTLRSKNHQRVTDMANQRGYTPQRMLNDLLDDFFNVLEKKHRQNSISEE